MGRHSAHRPASTYIGFGIAAAAAVAAGTLVAGTAHADGSGISWDSIARCESGGNWSIATGNGYLGGLQWTLGTWAANGGTGNPAGASREAQIAVAEHIIATQGVTRGLANWPVCGKRAWSGAASKTATGPAPGMPTYSGPTVMMTVAPGDTLSGIAAARNVTGGWAVIYGLNRGVLSDPDVIAVGQQLKVPA